MTDGGDFDVGGAAKVAAARDVRVEATVDGDNLGVNGGISLQFGNVGMTGREGSDGFYQPKLSVNGAGEGGGDGDEERNGVVLVVMAE